MEEREEKYEKKNVLLQMTNNRNKQGTMKRFLGPICQYLIQKVVNYSFFFFLNEFSLCDSQLRLATFYSQKN